MPLAFVRTLVLIKKAAAQANARLECLPQAVADAIGIACDRLLDDDNLMRHFPVDVYQTGSGTSSNMNANEVIAHPGQRRVGGARQPQ